MRIGLIFKMFGVIEDIVVLDDVIPVFLQDYFHGMILGKVDNEDIYPTVDFTVKYEPTAEEGGIAPLSFNHILKSSTRLSSHLENFSLIPSKACEYLKYNMKDILYGRIYLTLPYNSNLDYAKPHTDLKYKHYVVLYYVNDSDGDTVFFNKHNKIIKRVTPKKGRVVVFDGSILHGGGIPKISPRAVVNFDILI
tara:strand:- start:469 stop:1050 length:582 start_codon:yes stop_codon:yes gene_type:complete